MLPALGLSKSVFVDLPVKSFKHLHHAEINYKVHAKRKKNITLKLKERELSKLSGLLHKHNDRCGGFVTRPLKSQYSKRKGWDDNKYPVNYNLTKPELVLETIDKVKEDRILADMTWFSSYHTRYYTAPSGIKAMKDLHKKWSAMAAHRNDIKVELFKHKEWEQPSVILTFKGSTKENIIVGGHGDSINTDDEGPHSHSPGVDDNASGISTITEIIRVLLETNYKSKHNLQFMAFAAEEVGLRGSMDITAKYDAEITKVRGYLNLDGTNFKGSSDINFAIISDETDKEQNEFLASLIDNYLKLPWGYDQCNYGCSDHYSFKYRNFRASFPAEARIAEENQRIHTVDDTFAVMGNNATHAVSFAKLGLTYVLELDK